MLIVASRGKTRFLSLIPGFIAIVGWIVFQNIGLISSYVLLVIGILILAIGIYFYIRRPIPELHDRS